MSDGHASGDTHGASFPYHSESLKLLISQSESQIPGGASVMGMPVEQLPLFFTPHRFGLLSRPQALRSLDTEQSVPELVGHIFLGHQPVVVADAHITRGGELPKVQVI
jgi:hypothetical protein